MLLENLIQEGIGRFDLLHLSRPRNNNFPRTEDTHCDAFALPLPFTCTLPLANLLTGADSWTTIARIVEVLGIHTLIDGFLQHTEEIVFINQQFMERILINETIDGIIRIDELDGESMNAHGLVKRGFGKALNQFIEPVQGRTSKALGGHTRHLDTSVCEEFDIDLFPCHLLVIGALLLVLLLLFFLPLPLPTIGSFYLASHNNGGLIKECLVRDFTMCKDILVAQSQDSCAIFDLQHTLCGVPKGQDIPLQGLENGAKAHWRSPMRRNDHRGDAEGGRCNAHGYQLVRK